MIDLGLAKLALIGVVALIVIGPEKLPRVARMAGSMLGRAQRYINEVKAEVSRDIELEELRNIKQEVVDAASELKSSVTKEIAEVEQSVHSILPESNPPAALHQSPPSQQFSRKAREFHRKKVARNSALPAWYKQQQGGKTNILSAAARVAKYRPKKSTSSFF